MNIKLYYRSKDDIIKSENFLEFTALSKPELINILGYLHQYFNDITTMTNQYTNAMVLNYGFGKIKNFEKNKNKLFNYYNPEAVILNLLFSGNAAIHASNIDICLKIIKKEKEKIYNSQIAHKLLEPYATLSIVDNMLKVCSGLYDVEFFSICCEEMQLDLISNGIEYPDFQSDIGTYNPNWIFEEYINKFSDGM